MKGYWLGKMKKKYSVWCSLAKTLESADRSGEGQDITFKFNKQCTCIKSIFPFQDARKIRDPNKKNNKINRILMLMTLMGGAGGIAQW